MLDLLAKLLFFKLPLNERMFKFWFDFFEWAFRLLVATGFSLLYYAVSGKADFFENTALILLLFISSYATYVMIHFMNGCEDFLKGKD